MLVYMPSQVVKEGETMQFNAVGGTRVQIDRINPLPGMVKELSPPKL